MGRGPSWCPLPGGPCASCRLWSVPARGRDSRLDGRVQGLPAISTLALPVGLVPSSPSPGGLWQPGLAGLLGCAPLCPRGSQGAGRPLLPATSAAPAAPQGEGVRLPSWGRTGHQVGGAVWWRWLASGTGGGAPCEATDISAGGVCEQWSVQTAETAACEGLQEHAWEHGPGTEITQYRPSHLKGQWFLNVLVVI